MRMPSGVDMSIALVVPGSSIRAGGKDLMPSTTYAGGTMEKIPLAFSVGTGQVL